MGEPAPFAGKGHSYSSQTRGTFCDHCTEGFVEFDAAEESAWMDFRNRIESSLNNPRNPHKH